jgi:hypothetical protein
VSVFLLVSEALLHIIEFLNLLGEHVGDDQDLFGEALVLVDEDLLVLKVLVLLLLHLLSCLKKGESQLLAALLGLIQVVGDVILFHLYVFVELQLLIKGIHGRLEVVVLARKLGLVILDKGTVLGGVIWNFYILGRNGHLVMLTLILPSVGETGLSWTAANWW